MFQPSPAEPETPDQIFEHRSRMPVPAEALFAWHARSGAFERLVPPWSGIRLIERRGGLEPGARTVLSMPFGPFRLRWVAEHVAYEPNRSFCDVQRKGPFRRWEHHHSVIPGGARASELEDRIEYALPFGRVGRLVAESMVRHDLERTFTYRHRTTYDDLAVHAARSRRPLRIGVTGSENLIGAALTPFLTTGGHHVVRIDLGQARDAERAREHGAVSDAAALENLDAVIHLEGYASWTGRRGSSDLAVRRALERLRAVVAMINGLRVVPRALVCLSDIGIYGARGYERLSDDATPGGSELWRDWERTLEGARTSGIRLVNLRAGVVLTAAGGVLARMIRALRAGFFPVPGDGRQFVSWVGIDDVLCALLYALSGDELDGNANLTAPEPVTGRKLADALVRTVHGSAHRVHLPQPARAFFTALAAERLRTSTRAMPYALLKAGYEFRHSSIESLLGHTLGAPEIPAQLSV